MGCHGTGVLLMGGQAHFAALRAWKFPRTLRQAKSNNRTVKKIPQGVGDLHVARAWRISSSCRASSAPGCRGSRLASSGGSA